MSTRFTLDYRIRKAGGNVSVPVEVRVRRGSDWLCIGKLNPTVSEFVALYNALSDQEAFQFAGPPLTGR